MLESYVVALATAPLAEQSRRTYASKVRQFLVWLADAEVDGDPLGSAEGRYWAVRDYRGYLLAVLKRSPATVNNALAAVDDFYIRRGLGPASVKRSEVSASAPRALSECAQVRYLRAVQGCGSARDRALALVPFYAGTRIAETVALDVEDVRLSARKGVLRVLGKGQRARCRAPTGCSLAPSDVACRGAAARRGGTRGGREPGRGRAKRVAMAGRWGIRAVATALGWLLRDRDARIPVSDTPAAIRARLEQLRGAGILELEHGAYRASEIALYSSYQLPLPAAPPATDKRMRQITAIE